MTISANRRAAPSEALEQSLELYRDLSMALAEKIAELKAGDVNADGCNESSETVKSHRKALQTVLEFEASLVKRSNAWIEGTSLELDLIAARAEIVARLAVWVA